MARKVKESETTESRPRAGRRRTRLSSKNQATIPVEVLKASGLKSGDVLTVEPDGPGRVVLQTAESLIEKYAGCAPPGTFPPGYLEELRKEWDRPWD